MKAVIYCECGNAVELVPVDNGQHSYVEQQFKGRFEISRHNVEIDIESSANLNDDFVETLGELDDSDDRKEYLENNITDNVDTEAVIDSIRIDCTNCDSYIVLTAMY